jgi:hypothetical protein
MICLIAITTILIGSKSHEKEYFAIPSAVGLLWSITTYSFLVYFHAVPEKADQSWKFVKRLKRRIVRAGYWIMGVVFIATTIGAILVSYRMIAIWLRDYG